MLVLLLATLSLTPPTPASTVPTAQGGDLCSQPTTLTTTGAFVFNTTSATTSGFTGSSPCDDTVSEAHKDLFWTFTAPTGGHYQFDTFGSAFDTVLGVYRGDDCQARCIARNDNSQFLQSSVRVIDLQVGETVLVQVGGYTSPFPTSPPEFGPGVLHIESFLDPCDGQFTPDYIDENDSCDGAVALSDGLYEGLSASDIDPDFYAVEVAPGDTLQVNLFDPIPQADLVLLLWESSAVCRESDLNGPLASSRNNNYTGTWDEWITHTNTGAVAATYIIEVFVISSSSCTDYDMDIRGTTGPAFGAPVGSGYCTAVVNSSGEAANLWAIGSDAAADNDLRLVSASVPAHSFGFLIVGSQAGFVMGPGGSSGNLCVGGNVGRFIAPGQVQNSGPRGEIDVIVDLAALPQPSGPVAAAPGEHWYFQLWMRDVAPSGPTSNFSNGVDVLLR